MGYSYYINIKIKISFFFPGNFVNTTIVIAIFKLLVTNPFYFSNEIKTFKVWLLHLEL